MSSKEGHIHFAKGHRDDVKMQLPVHWALMTDVSQWSEAGHFQHRELKRRESECETISLEHEKCPKSQNPQMLTNPAKTVAKEVLPKVQIKYVSTQTQSFNIQANKT